MSGSSKYKELADQKKEIALKIKELKITILEEYKSEIDALDIIKAEIEMKEDQLSELALVKHLKGEDTELTDKYNNKYQPQLTLKFVKA